MRSILGIAILVLGLLPTAHAQSWAREFEFIDLAKCSQDYYFHKLCGIFSGKFADWDAESRGAVEKVLARLPRLQLDALGKLHHNPPQKILLARMTTGLEQAGTVNGNGIAAIALHPQFFLAESTVAGVPEKLHTFTHELLHIIGLNLEMSPFWTELALALEWRFPNGPNPIPRGKEMSDLIKQMNALYKSGTPAERQRATDMDRAFARPRGFPSVYSSVSLTEYFAELGAFLIFDPTLANDLPDEVPAILRKYGMGALVPANWKPGAKIGQPRLKGTPPVNDTALVGMVLLEQRPTCSGVVVRHGLIVTAKSCLSAYVKRTSDQSEAAKHPYFGFEFRDGSGTLVYFSGFALDLSLDPGDGDLAYIGYEPALTTSLFKLPNVRLATSADLDMIKSKELYTLSFPLPFKPHRLKPIWSGACSSEGATEAGLVSTNCAAGPSSTGGAVFSKEGAGLVLWGVIKDPTGASYSVDSWGRFVLGARFTPITAAKYMPRN